VGHIGVLVLKICRRRQILASDRARFRLFHRLIKLLVWNRSGMSFARAIQVANNWLVESGGDDERLAAVPKECLSPAFRSFIEVWAYKIATVESHASRSTLADCLRHDGTRKIPFRRAPNA